MADWFELSSFLLDSEKFSGADAKEKKIAQIAELWYPIVDKTRKETIRKESYHIVL